jgi:hypothetical protein
MATSGTFYLDAPSLSTASVVYSNAALTTVAANGFYSDGSIVREQVSGALLPQQACPACAVPCGGVINLTGNQGVYYLNANLGSSTGAVIVEFDPQSVPDGVLLYLIALLIMAFLHLHLGGFKAQQGYLLILGHHLLLVVVV